MLSNLTIFNTILAWLGNLSAESWTAIATALTGFFTFIGAIVAAHIAVSGVRDTIEKDRENKRKELLDNLDSKSEWRKQLYDLASKTFLTTDDVYRVLASLRYLPKTWEEIENNENDQKAFDIATSEIFREMYRIIGNKYRDEKRDLNFRESEIVRLYTKYLLKHHWEWNSENADDYKKNKEEKQFREISKRVTDIKSRRNFENYLNDMKRYPD